MRISLLRRAGSWPDAGRVSGHRRAMVSGVMISGLLLGACSNGPNSKALSASHLVKVGGKDTLKGTTTTTAAVVTTPSPSLAARSFPCTNRPRSRPLPEGHRGVTHREPALGRSQQAGSRWNPITAGPGLPGGGWGEGQP